MTTTTQVPHPWYHHGVMCVVLVAMAAWAPLPEIMASRHVNSLHDVSVLLGAVLQGACLFPRVRHRATFREVASFFAVGPIALRVWQLAVVGVERIYPPEQAYLSAVNWAAIAVMFLIVEGMTNEQLIRNTT